MTIATAPRPCARVAGVTHYVRTAEAARALGVSASTLWWWWRAGKVHPALVTQGGQARWNVAKLRADLVKRSAHR